METYKAGSYQTNFDGRLDLLDAAIKASALAGKYLYIGFESETDDIDVHFSEALDAGEKTTLDGLMTTWGLGDTQSRLFKQIDAKASGLVTNGPGFEWPASSGQFISLSVMAQLKWMGMYSAKASLAYPIKTRTKDDKTQIVLADAADVQSAYDTAVIAVRAILDPAQDAKEDVNTATTVAEAEAAAAAYLG